MTLKITIFKPILLVWKIVFNNLWYFMLLWKMMTQNLSFISTWRQVFNDNNLLFEFNSTKLQSHYTSVHVILSKYHLCAMFHNVQWMWSMVLSYIFQIHVFFCLTVIPIFIEAHENGLEFVFYVCSAELFVQICWYWL